MNASPWRRLWREPLTRFFAAGAGLFVVYALVGGRAPTDDRHIVIDRYELGGVGRPMAGAVEAPADP